jgi:formylglycine-generating enzyme required for sulfatase activity
VSWYYGNSDKKTHPVGKLKPNSLGIYDMSGNAYEWCLDWFSNYDTKKAINPQGPATGDFKILRGGSWYDYFSHLSVTNRGNYNPDYMSNLIGFRMLKQP